MNYRNPRYGSEMAATVFPYSNQMVLTRRRYRGRFEERCDGEEKGSECPLAGHHTFVCVCRRLEDQRTLAGYGRRRTLKLDRGYDLTSSEKREKTEEESGGGRGGATKEGWDTQLRYSMRKEETSSLSRTNMAGLSRILLLIARPRLWLESTR